MAVFLSRVIPWIFVIGLFVGAYKLWMWAAQGGLSHIDRARALFFVFVAIAIGIVIVSKLF